MKFKYVAYHHGKKFPSGTVKSGLILNVSKIYLTVLLNEDMSIC